MILLLLSAIGLAIGVARAYKYKADKALFYERLLLPVIFVTVGINGILFGFIPHVFFSDMIADKIGWSKGNPFQLEVGYHDGCWGVIGLLSAWFKGRFALAAGIGWALFLLLAGWGHLHETIVNHNYAPYNFQFIAGDIIPAILLFVLSYLYYKHSYKRG